MAAARGETELGSKSPGVVGRARRKQAHGVFLQRPIEIFILIALPISRTVLAVGWTLAVTGAVVWPPSSCSSPRTQPPELAGLLHATSGGALYGPVYRGKQKGDGKFACPTMIQNISD